MQLTLATEGLQFPEGPIAMADGSVVLVEIRRGTLTRVTPDGGKTVVAKLGGGPNGAAIGPTGRSMSATTAARSAGRTPKTSICRARASPITPAARSSGST